jgi:hypothetical protein
MWLADWLAQIDWSSSMTEARKGVLMHSDSKRDVRMQGFASELIGEVLTKGKGPLGQIGIPLNTEVNPQFASVALAVWIGFFLFAAVGYGNWGQQEGDNEIY